MKSDGGLFGENPVDSVGPTSDPLSEVVSLARPRAVMAPLVTGRGERAVLESGTGPLAFFVALNGQCLLKMTGHEPRVLYPEEFVLVHAARQFLISSDHDVRLLAGHLQLHGVDHDLLLSLVPEAVHLRGSGRLSYLICLADLETRELHHGRDYLVARLAEMMLVESLRQTTVRDARPGLLQGLGDERLGRALSAMHARVDHPWTLAELAHEARMSRSGFHERFTLKIGVAPLEYLRAWRMEKAKHLLRGEGLPVSDVAARLGYSSLSTFSTAFSRQVGQSPAGYLRGD